LTPRADQPIVAGSGGNVEVEQTAAAHQWLDDECLACGLRRREEWVLDHSDDVVLTLVWSAPGGEVLRVRPFPVLLGLHPPSRPTVTVEQAFPGVPVGREPTCPTAPGTTVSP
jgi:hypothetical protein